MANKINIATKDAKDRKVVLRHRTIDVGTNIGIIPTNFEEMLDMNKQGKFNRFEFEVTKYGYTENILDEYIVFLSNSRFVHRVYFDRNQANVVAQNINAVSLLLYGDITLAWSINYLNDMIKHPSDLTFEVLTKDGILAFNSNGIDALIELKKYKEVNEQNEGTNDKEALFTLDSF